MASSTTSRTQAEQIIAVSRLGLAASSVFAVWMDPAETSRYTDAPYVLLFTYVAYAALFLPIPFSRRMGPRLIVATHVVDILFSALQYLTLGPSSPLFVYFVFSMFSGALRWGWKGTLVTSSVILFMFLLMTSFMSLTLGPADLSLNRVIIRIVYLVMAAGMLVYLGRYEARLRSEIERLARWPAPVGASPELALGRIVSHACQILGADRAVIVWESDERSAIQIASWSVRGLRVSERPAAQLSPMLPASIASRAFLVSDEVHAGSTLTMSDAQGSLVERQGLAVDAGVLALIEGVGLASAPFQTERLSGRAFFVDIPAPSAELIPLTEVVAREIGTSLDQMHLARQQQELAAREERIRLARDLHDGVLQSLTGIRFELRSLADTLVAPDDGARARLLGLERALSIEQRELRLFIGGLKPATAGHVAPDSLTSRLDALRERLALEWNTPVSIRVSPESQDCSSELAQAVPLMVHEAVVNALKHAQPTRVNVNVDSATDRLRIVVSDDGHGFPFKGSYDHRALKDARTAPRSLFDRVSALGGKMSIESSDAGSRIEMVVSL